MRRQVDEETRRCLKCKKPGCKSACPVGTPVNELFQMVQDGKIIEAGEMLFKNNPLSVVCSLICPHEIQCEGNCVLGLKGNPIQISTVENYISDYYINILNEKPEKDPEKKLAIIGSGPAGITIAFILADRGYDITIYEGYDKIGGILRYGIPEFRLPKRILDQIQNKLVYLGIKIRPNIFIGSTITIDDLFRDGYKAVFIGTGVWKPNTLKIKGETLGHVHFAIDYLKNPDVYDLGRKVCVIGAGNVAMDVARTCLRKGAKEVYIMYRKGDDEIPALKHEVDYARIDGVRFEFFKTPVEILDKGVKYMTTQVIIQEDGTEELGVVENSEGLFECDSVIVAVSQGPKARLVSSTIGLNVNGQGLLITDQDGHTTKDGVFASGDVVTGAKTVVEAVQRSKRVAGAIDAYVAGILRQ